MQLHHGIPLAIILPNFQIQELQNNLAESEQTHAQRLINLTTRRRQETEVETERLRSSQVIVSAPTLARESENEIELIPFDVFYSS